MAGTGLAYSYSGNEAVTINDPNAAGNAAGATVAGAIALDTIDVSGGGSAPEDVPYQTPGSTSYISEQDIQRFRGTSTGDIFKGTPGVISGTNRNGAAVDVNIRGLQGMNRIATTIDGADQSSSTWRGYVGVDNRTYVDPDMIGGITITKGPDGGVAGATGGTVAMETLRASDILKPGDTYGARVRVSGSTNGVAPEIGATTWHNKDDDMFGIANGSASVATAARSDNADFVAAYVRRQSDNYFAGTDGPLTVDDAGNSLGSTVLRPRPLSPYKYGDEVLNTSQDVASLLLKATVRPAEGHELKLGYLRYENTYGEVTPTIVASTNTLSRQVPLSHTVVDQMTARYSWKPADGKLIDLKVNGSLSNIDDDTVYSVNKDSWYRDTRSLTYGIDAANTSRFDIASTALSLSYGGAFKFEDASPRKVTTTITTADFFPANGTRRISSAFVKGKWEPVDWLALDAGATYLAYQAHNRGRPPESYTSRGNPMYADYEGSGVSPSFGVTVTPIDGWQLFAKYATGIRAPSLRESTYTASVLVFNPNLRAEEQKNWEFGTNLLKDGLVLDGDKAKLKLAYFDNETDDYIGRTAISSGVLTLFNYDKVEIKGVELSGGYDAKVAFVDFALNYYTDFKPCPTAGTCVDYTMQTDYLTNYVPPKFTASATFGVRLFDEKLTVGGRVNYAGERATRVVADPLYPFVTIPWAPYTVLDAFAQVKLNDDFTLDLSAENIADRYYVDALNRTDMPAPGRTFRGTLTAKFGGSDPASIFGLPESKGRDVDWTGFHVGGHLGHGTGAIDGVTTAGDGTPGGIPATESVDQSFKNVLYGVQAGYDYQLPGSVVLGIEGDFSWTRLGTEFRAISTEVPTITEQYQAATEYQFDRMATLRGRAGYAFNDLLFYATGGLALLNETESRTQFRSSSTTASRPLTVPLVPWFSEENTELRVGWTLGGGLEYAFGGNWSLKGEYLYASFGDELFSFPNARSGVAVAGNTPATRPGSSNVITGRNASNEVELQSAKIGLNYRF